MEWSDEVAPVAAFLSSAAVPDLMEWLRRSLEGVDHVAGERGRTPHSLVGSSFESLDHGVRVNLQEALALLIKEIAHDPSSWSERAVTELLLLTDAVLLTSSRRADVANEGGTSEVLGSPVSPREEVINELRLRLEQKEAREVILSSIESAPSSEAEWREYFDDLE